MTAASYQGGFCRNCYAEAITRLCNGFTITRSDGSAATAVPPLPAGLAALVRQAARKQLDERSPGSTSRHPHHAGAGHDQVLAMVRDELGASAAKISAAPGRDDVRSLMQGFAASRPPGCPWGSPPGCRCANCYEAQESQP